MPSMKALGLIPAAIAALAVSGPLTGRIPPAQAGACVSSPILRGAPPNWSRAAWSDSSPGFRLPYALASGDSAAAFLWVRLRAGNPSNPANKVLWVTRYPRNHSPLRISARWSRDPSIATHSLWPADSSPGQIYPSYINLPKAGCWHLTLRWNGHVASINLDVAPKDSPAGRA